ncbi:hypothetical protein U5817_08140 [Aromatoleum evansii]|uniref:Sigma-54 factor interaction domain-containing protein n=1 Tax=Aromatoleum evansii TaxID=59406 RepID=A0ABZ1AQ63_AROEV|nr:hypothetical protein U5817_08140 [Aromatoleum evansii]
MGKTKFEQILNTALAGVDLSGSHSNKFDRLVGMLAPYWGVDPEAIGVKALAASKNYGNRVSEATRTSIRYLVLLADEEVKVQALARSLETRALKLVPTVLAVCRAGVWEGGAIFLTRDADNPFELDVRVETLNDRRFEALERSDADRIRASILTLAGSSAGTDVEAFLNARSDGRHETMLKRVTDLKNLNNRIGEAIGQRPHFLVIQVPRELVKTARRVLEEQLTNNPATYAFLVFEGEGGISVEPVWSARSALENDVVLHRVPHLPSPALERQVAWEQPEFPGIETRRDPGGDLQYRRLERVKQLGRHLPFDADANHLYEERQESSDRLAYETKALGYVRRLLTERERLVVVLTGNAGHGKTHLCRRLLEAGGANGDVMKRLCGDPTGTEDWVVEGSPLPIRIIKDLSEINPPEAASSLLREFIRQQNAHVIVCANEGRLRDVVSRDPADLKVLTDALERGLDGGETCIPEREDIHVLNLNHQAATAGEGGFFEHALDHFLNHESAWKVCKSCRASGHCPILANRNDLARSSVSSPENASRRKALRELVRLAEEGGYVLTFRETLEFVAYLVTGRLSCIDVERLHRNHELGKLNGRRILPLLFELPLNDDDAETLPLLLRLRRLDPGLVALRPIDDRIHEQLEEIGMLGAGVFGEAAREVYLKADLQHEEEHHREIVRRARREAWFTAPSDTDHGERLGLRHHHVFRSLQGEPAVGDVINAIRSLIRGLHTIQGAIGVESTSSFHLVDPAFGRSGSHAAVIARSIRIRDLDLMTESNWWRRRHAGGAPPILDSVEWIDRRLVLVENGETEKVIVALDLLAFEFVMNAGNGIVMREFHSAERRRILRTLARLAESGRDPRDDIRVLVGRGEGRLIIERDDTIFLERNA